MKPKIPSELRERLRAASMGYAAGLREGERRGLLRAACILAKFNRKINALQHPAVALIRTEAKKLRGKR